MAGPKWLQTRRTEAAERFSSAALPTAEEEVWRYSRIGDLDLSQFEPGADALSVSFDVPAEWVDAGVQVQRGDAVTETSGLGSVALDGPDVFATLNDAFASDPITIVVPRGVQLTQALTITTEVRGSHRAAFPRLVIQVGEGAAATVLERVTSPEGDEVLTVPLTELSVARGARLDFAVVQQLGAAGWQIGSVVADVAQEANLRAAQIGLGGAYARVRTDCRLSGRGGHGELLAAYFGDGDQTLDFRTFQHHDAPDTTSNLLFKGAVGGRSRSVYTGLIRVDKAARGTNAFQTNRNVKLSDDAWAESVPNLEIETNDVHCSHASTVGPVDEEQRFYLESRGVPPKMADRLIVAGFFNEVVRQLPDDALVAEVSARIEEKLDRVEEDLA